jgi:hypothetical protein
MSYFEKFIPAFLSGEDKVPVDAGKGHALPVTLSGKEQDLLEEIRDLLIKMNMYLAEIVGEEL